MTLVNPIPLPQTAEERRFTDLLAEAIETDLLSADGTTPGLPMRALGYAPPAGVNTLWADTATQVQKDQWAAKVAAWDWSETEENKLDQVVVPNKLIIAMSIRLSTQYAGLTAGQKSKVQNLIDKYSQKGIAALS